MKKEIWKPVKGYEDHYEVSNMGNLRSILYKNRNTVKKRDVPIILKQHSNLGYMRVQLCRKMHNVQRLVLTAFVGDRPDGMQAAHLNGIRNDNRVENLKWVTPKENSSHRWIHGTMLYGENASVARLNDKKVIAIRRKRLLGQTTASLSKEYKVSAATIRMVVNNSIWKHVSAQSMERNKEGEA